MNTYIDTVKLDDGNIQKYQVVTGFDWEDMKFGVPKFEKKVMVKFSNLYRLNIIPKDPSLYGILYFYQVPESLELNLSNDTDLGEVYDKTILVNYYFQKASHEGKVKEVDETLIFEDDNLQRIFDELKSQKLVSSARGVKKDILFLPLYDGFGYMSSIKGHSLKVNSHFFLMEMFDRDSGYDLIGTPHSLALYKNKILLPPLNHRKALLVQEDGTVVIRHKELAGMKITIGDKVFTNCSSTKYFYRPETRVTDKVDGYDIIIVNSEVVALKKGGQSRVPMAGFIIQVKGDVVLTSHSVEYENKKNYKFGIQVGPAMMIDGLKEVEMSCPMYDGNGAPYPSTVYPMNFHKSRAARIGLGEIDNKPILIWAEGAGKLGYIKGKESCGASLSEFADFCESKGIRNLVNLDGGGSAQLIYKDKKYLKIADRLDDTVTEDERPVPNCILI